MDPDQTASKGSGSIVCAILAIKVHKADERADSNCHYCRKGLKGFARLPNIITLTIPMEANTMGPNQTASKGSGSLLRDLGSMPTPF